MQIRLIPVYPAIPQEIQVLYESAFPLYERRPWHLQELLVRENKLQLKEILIDNNFAGFVFYWQLVNCIFIEHFAITQPARGKGTGSKVMQLLASEFTSIVLETETEEQGENARRRILFYEKLGYKKFPFAYQQPPYAPGHSFQKMNLIHNNQQTPEEVFNMLKKEIYTKVYNLVS